MPDFLSKISDADRLDFSQNLSVARPAYLGDRLFPDQKTQNMVAEYLRLASGAAIPVMASVHALDTEAEIGSRPVFDMGRVEKLLIKRKINQTERIQLLAEHGVNTDDAIIRYVFDDMRIMADAVKVRTEVAKMELLSSGKMTIHENRLDFDVNYHVPAENTAYELDLGPNADIIGQIQTIVDNAADNGETITELVTSKKVVRKLAANKGVQTLIFGSVGQGSYVPMDRLQSLFGQMFGFSTITTNDLRYKVQRASGAEELKRFYPDNKLTFLSSGGTSFGIGLWGVTPEEKAAGPYIDKSANQYITLTQWATPDPVAVWTKASGMFIPVLPNPNGLYIAKDTTAGG